MDACEFEDFDPTSYQNLPRLSVNASLVLARKLLVLVPKPTTERVRDAASRVRVELDRLEAALAERRALTDEATLRREAELDHFVDGLWQSLYVRLDSWSVYERPGMDQLAASPGEVDHARHVKRAQRARKILRVLFGDEGTAFVDRSYREQAAAMARIFRKIERNDLANAINSLVGPDLLAALRDARVHYEEMVRIRSAREQNLGVGLRMLAEQMRWRLSLYVIHVLSLLDRRQPATLPLVRASLQPIQELRQATRVRCDGSESSEWSYESLRRP